ncbi:MAG: TIGR00725 family protein [Acidobacteria bacterium]|nr:TIGR00725 family protein [Acidobacteriota bacterium]
MRRTIVGVMGPGGGASQKDLDNARRLGALVARQGWVVLCGGRGAGVMDAVCRGAKEAGGLTVGVLPGDDAGGASEAVDIAVVTGMGNARNAINVLSSDLVVACGMGAGTASEIALALKAGKNVIVLGDHPEAIVFFRALGKGRVTVARDSDEAIAAARRLLGR